MSIYRITDVTPVGAYMNAMKARHDGDRREAERLAARRKSPGVIRRLALRGITLSRGLLEGIAGSWSRRSACTAPASFLKTR